ncbi:hypothetical protein FACS189447_04450 [Spirochaetia bacterium]|nr:hypothetical protein FACS189447_04450 [Spirochaetia bacterium]
MDGYSWLKGFNYVPSYARNDIEFWRDYDPLVIEREMGYAKRLGLNCARVFLAQIVYKDDTEKFISSFTHFVKTAYKNGIQTLPCVWDSCFSEAEPLITANVNEWIPNPGVMYLDSKFWDSQKPYCDALIKAMKDEPGLLMWDIHNEPTCTAYVTHYQGAEKERHIKEIWTFVEHWCAYFKEHDKRPVTVGVMCPEEFETVGPWCTVLSFHDYSPTWKGINTKFDIALKAAEKFSKPVFCSEMSCPARSNPYDITIQIAGEKHIGYIVWELMIGCGFWGDRHGILYPDGTVRDPSIVSAIAGFYRKRNTIGRNYYINTEGRIDRTLEQAKTWLDNPKSAYDEGLEIACSMAYLTESGNLVPLNILPTAKYAELERSSENRTALEALMREWMLVLRADADKKGSSTEQMVYGPPPVQ